MNDTIVAPWCEVNFRREDEDGTHPFGETYLDRALNGLRYWRSAVDEAIVTTNPLLVEQILPEFVAELAPMQIVGGAATNPAIKNRLDNVLGWEHYRDAINATCRITGARRFLVENETGWKQMRLGKYIPDWDKVRTGLKLLPRDIEYTWYPGIACRVDGTRESPWCADDLALQTKFLEIVVDTLPHVRLATFEHQSPGSPTSVAERARQEYVLKHFKVETVPIVYFIDKSWSWKPDQIIEARDTCQSPHMLAYPGTDNVPIFSAFGPLSLRNDSLQRDLSVAREAEQEALQRVEAAEQLATASVDRSVRAEATLATARLGIVAARTSMQSVRQRISGADLEAMKVSDDLDALFESSTPETEPDDLTPEAEQ